MPAAQAALHSLSGRDPSVITWQTKRYRTSDGLTLVADIGGDPTAQPVILLHGGGQTRHSWRGLMRELVDGGYHAISLDARGHGESGWSPTEAYGLDSLADDLRTVIATLPYAPALVGASMGGATGLYAVGMSTDPVADALVLVDIVPRLNPQGAANIVGFMRGNLKGFATLDEAAHAVAAYNPHRPRPKDISGLMKNLRLRDDGRLHWHWDPAFFKERESTEPPQFSDQLHHAAKGVRIPVMLVRGLQSDIVDDAGIAELRGYLPQLEVFDVEGAGHMVAGDRNDAFNRGVMGFLRRTLPPRRTP
jgi:pimeloyl-ACP methyl ester carboxylesterase